MFYQAIFTITTQKKLYPPFLGTFNQMIIKAKECTTMIDGKVLIPVNLISSDF